MRHRYVNRLTYAAIALVVALSAAVAILRTA